MNLTLQQIADACSGTLYRAEGKENDKITGAVLDSRLVQAGFLFFATRGERVDGHSFIATAVQKGASCVVCEREPECEDTFPYILVKDSFQALKDIAEDYRKRLDITVVGITGSVGKTSTKEFIAGVLAEKFSVLKTEGNFNNEIGLPLTILKIREEHQVAVVEMGISEFGEMHRLSKVARPDICVITNIGQCHLENLKSRDGILKAKTEIFDFMQENGYVLLNGDDDKLVTIKEVQERAPVFFGLEENSYNAVYATDIVNKGLFGSEAVMHLEGEEYPIEVTLPGRHMVSNALAAAAVARILGMDASAIMEGIKKVQPVGGRSNIIRAKHYTIIDDCYNANPVSMKAALDLLQTAKGRRVAILGDMFELGANEKELHKEVGSYATGLELDVMVCVGGLSKNLYDGAMLNKDNTSQVCHYETREALMEDLPSILQEKDTVLIKASHGMHFEEIVRVLESE